MSRAPLRTGSEIGIGPFRLLFDGDSLLARDDRGAVRLDVREVSVRVGERQLLAPTSLSVEPGQLVGVIGSSGCGKTTLVRALAGVSEPSDGTVELNGEPVSTRLTDVGYLPQEEIVHTRLTVREALRYAARLRLPGDVSAEELEASKERTLEELSLLESADRRIDTLSGGERRPRSPTSSSRWRDARSTTEADAGAAARCAAKRRC